MKTNSPQNRSEDQLLLDAAGQRINTLFAQGCYQQALDLCLDITRTYPQITGAWIDAAVNCVKLGRWQDALGYAQTALAHGGDTLALHDALAYAHGQLMQWDAARRHGLQALHMRARQFGGEPVTLLPEPRPMPPPPSARTRERNIIAFSLFGSDSKYCEPAVLNVQEQARIYPHWVCRFYVDGSVPDSVIARLAKSGAQIVPVAGPAAQWPGPMWRFLALDDPLAHRLLFRDADSVISRREAGAVAQWIAGGQRFHNMRDWCSHTELMQAGLWGAVGGSLPPLEQLMHRFLSAPLASRYFADQFFLRQYVWPYARTSLMQHDSVFGFMDAAAFPDGTRPEDFHVGCTESLELPFKTDLPEGSAIIWALFRTEQHDDGQNREKMICAYASTVQDGTVKAHIPRRYVRWIEQGTARVRVRLIESTTLALPPADHAP